MRPENEIVHTLWVGERLSLLEQLTIHLLQRHGHTVHLWAYQSLQNVPSGTVVRDASEVLPEESVFRYEGEPVEGIPNGGVGSLSHWSDQFQMKLLHRCGGIYSQLDVSVFAPFDFDTPYVFSPHSDRSIAPVIMKCPKDSAFALSCYERLSSEIHPGSISHLDWDCSMRVIMEKAQEFGLHRDEYVLNRREYRDLGARRRGPFYSSERPDPEVRYIHWSNATNRLYKDDPIPNSFYEQLLKEAGLVSQNEPARKRMWRYLRYPFRNATSRGL